MRVISVKKTVFICKIDQRDSLFTSFALLINGTAKKQLNIKTKLIITGRRTSPNKRIKIKDVINKIAKYTDSSFEKNRSKNLLKKSSINILF